jgi:hypothetical protein
MLDFTIFGRFANLVGKMAAASTGLLHMTTATIERNVLFGTCPSWLMGRGWGCLANYIKRPIQATSDFRIRLYQASVGNSTRETRAVQPEAFQNWKRWSISSQDCLSVCCQKYSRVQAATGDELYMAMSADATCRGLRSSTEGQFVMEFKRGQLITWHFYFQLAHTLAPSFCIRVRETRLLVLSTGHCGHDILWL